MVKEVTFTIFAILFLMQCNLKCDHFREPNKQKDSVENIPTPYSLNIEEIYLDNGLKWKVPSKMYQIIFKIRILVMDSSDNINYHQKATLLNKLLAELTNSCTMKGQGHDELHKILIPLIEQAEVFESQERAEDLLNSFNKIEDILKLYPKYFEEEKI